MKRLLAAVALLASLPTVAGCGSSEQHDVAARYLAAWSGGEITKAAALTSDPATAAAALRRFREDMHVRALGARLGDVRTSGTHGTAVFTATVTTDVDVRWSWRGGLSLVRAGGRWRVTWTPADVHPGLGAGERLALLRQLPPRANLLDDTGTPLFTPRTVVDVGIEPRRAGSHLAATLTAVANVTHVDARALAAAAKAARPDAFVPVITLRQAAYEQIRARIYDLPGTVFRTRTALLPPTTGFARSVLGSVGDATADVLRRAGPSYAAGDQLGIAGLQEAFQRRLAGTATERVAIVAADGTTKQVLATFPGGPGHDVPTTLDVATQVAAEQALARTSKPAALVAIRPSDGAILAAANSPTTTSFDRALAGHYPPGSTFKIVTGYALLGAGVTANTPVPCPSAVTVGGRRFTNFEGEAAASATFARDFAQSCNTAFIGASRRLGAAALTAAAGQLGIGAQWRLPIAAYSGSVPSPTDSVDRAAEAIGQGRITVSPLAMAVVAAAVVSGRPPTPTLVREPATSTAPPAAPLPAARLATLRALMRLVVTSGTAASAGLPPGTFGKTGTAEFGGGATPQTHAWFVGWRGDVAFAVVVEGGGVGGRVAAPIAAAFLRRLAPTRVG